MRVLNRFEPDAMPVVVHSYSDRGRCVAGLAQVLSERLAQALLGGARARLLLPGGSSPQALLPLLAASGLDWTKIDVSLTDERWVPSDAPQSNLRLLREGLACAHILDPRQAADASQSAQCWAEQLSAWSPISAVLLGMGEDGHFASLFAGMPGLAAALDKSAVPGALMGCAPDEPRVRLSLNLAMLLSGDWLGLLAFGEAKRQLIEAVQADHPATRALPLHALLHGGSHTVHIHWAL